jgi:hypothetical protein
MVSPLFSSDHRSFNAKFRYYVSGNYVASRLGLPKGTDIYAHCDQVFGFNPPYWDDNQKHSVLAAWFELE